mmetsp:Transcript_69299/g.184491  ORF Transcript_69299/g.184491 Transcript_69299/m.184491 type:complete len:255 (+) Transcript_69299:317-1081(+)
MATSLALVALLLQRLQVGDERSLHRRLEHEVHELREVLTPRPARAKHGRRVSPQLPLCHRARFVGDRQQLLHLCLRRLAQLLLRHHRVDHPEGERLAGRHERAELQHPLGLALADDVAEHRREPRRRDEAEVDLIEAHPVAALRHHSRVARERDEAAARRAVARDGRDRREAAHVQPQPELLDGRPELGEVLGRLVRREEERLEVEARAEDARDRRADQQPTHRAVLLELREDRAELVAHGERESIDWRAVQLQ